MGQTARGHWNRNTLYRHAPANAKVAEVVAFLASPRASYITGQVIHVNGGAYTQSP